MAGAGCRADHSGSRGIPIFCIQSKGRLERCNYADIMAIIEKLFDGLDEDSERVWNRTELRNLLFELIEHTYEYEHFDEVEIKAKPVRDSQAPLIQIIDDDISMLILLKDLLEDKGWMVIASAISKVVERLFKS